MLLDADGVLQHLPGGWFAAMEPYLGERAREFLLETWSDEKPFLRGDGDYLPELARALAAYGVADPVEVVYAAVWHRIEVVEQTVALIHDLRAAGYGVHLGTNQERRRADYMRTTLGYDDLFDVSCYSCELKAAKPDPEFFRRAAALIGAEPATICFVDDSEPNVTAAREAGLVAVHWALEQGHPALIALLADNGVALGS